MGVQCTDVRQHPDGVTATLVGPSGETELLSCEYLVACDGINSRVRRLLGLEQDESDYAGTVMQNLDAFLVGFPDADDYVHYCAGTDHFVMIVKLPGGFYRLLLSDRGEAADPDITPERAFMRLIDRHFDGVRLGDVVWHSKWESWVRLAHTYREGKVFLAGDSAHVHSTTGGQGMNCCLQDAYNLGWKLGLVMQGLAQPGLLDTYETERRPIAEQVIWAASSLHEIFMGHGKSIAERAQRIHDKVFLDAVVGRCSGISYTYRDAIHGENEAGGPVGLVAGDRAPDVDFEQGGTLYDLTRHTKFTLLAIAGDREPTADLEPVLAPVVERFGTLVETHALKKSPALDRHYGGAPESELILIRPDGYIGYRCRADEADLLCKHLGSFLRL
jgi:hypothetical protein